MPMNVTMDTGTARVQRVNDCILTNARLVLADRVIERGWVAVSDGLIAEFGEGDAPERGEDIGGELLLPGLVELHTDQLEVHYTPRPKVRWDPVAAVVSFDGQLATSGITTVLDSLRVWSEESMREADGEAATLDRKSTRLNSSHVKISYAVFCL